MTQAFTLNNQLNKDTHLLLEDENFFILLHKNATIPWIILVPKSDVIEFYDLSNDMQLLLNTLIKRIANYFKDKFTTEKMNIAAIGNIVSELHVHVIGRKIGDACWPGVIWGKDYTYLAYSKKQIIEIATGIMN